MCRENSWSELLREIDKVRRTPNHFVRQYNNLIKSSAIEETYDSWAIYSAGFTTLPTNTGTFPYGQLS